MTQAEQREIALARANAIHVGRAEVKRRLRDGAISVAGALEHPCCQSMCVIDLLCAQRWWGLTKTAKFLRRLEYRHVYISHARKVCALSTRERECLVALLDANTGKPRP